MTIIKTILTFEINGLLVIILIVKLSLKYDTNTCAESELLN